MTTNYQSRFRSKFCSKKAAFVYPLTASIIIIILLFTVGERPTQARDIQATGNQLEPMDLTFNNPSWSGNPYDLIATVTFSHASSDLTRTTEMFYAGNDEWKARFAGDLPGLWNYTSTSSDSDLNGLSGTIDIASSDNPGFVQASGDKWIRTGSGEAFVPQFVMSANPNFFYDNPSKIDSDIALFIEDHGFNGLHVKVDCRWFDIYTPICTYIDSSDPNPDQRTFEALEQIILETYKAGGVVHIWVWGDDERNQNAKKWGHNGTVDRRLQRYIAARLGPMPGWTMGYGFDLWEWTNESQLNSWYDYMHDHMGWPHMLGARSSKNQLDQLSERMDYSGYEQHRPDYNKYVETILTRPNKPSFSEDRFRVRDEGRSKDYTLDETRQGLWRSGMSGGIANIWGYLQDGGSDDLGSAAYPNSAQLKLFSDFFNERYHISLERCNDLSNGYCLKSPSNQQFLHYKENSGSIEIDLSNANATMPFMAIDTKTGNLFTGEFEATFVTWNASYTSDWAIAIGDFCALTSSESVCNEQVPTPTATAEPPTATPTDLPTNTPVPTATATATEIPPTPTPLPATSTPAPTATATPATAATPPSTSMQETNIYLPFVPHSD